MPFTKKHQALTQEDARTTQPTRCTGSLSAAMTSSALNYSLIDRDWADACWIAQCIDLMVRDDKVSEPLRNDGERMFFSRCSGRKEPAFGEVLRATTVLRRPEPRDWHRSVSKFRGPFIMPSSLPTVGSVLDRLSRSMRLPCHVQNGELRGRVATIAAST